MTPDELDTQFRVANRLLDVVASHPTGGTPEASEILGSLAQNDLLDAVTIGKGAEGPIANASVLILAVDMVLSQLLESLSVATGTPVEQLIIEQRDLLDRARDLWENGSDLND